MKSILALIGLVAFLGVALTVHENLKQTKAEQTIIGWSNSLVWSALQSPTAPRFLGPKLDKVGSNGRWRVAGDVEYRDREGSLVRETYSAMIDQSCPLRERQECWALASLDVGGKAVDLSPPKQDEEEEVDEQQADDSLAASQELSGDDAAPEKAPGAPVQTAVAATANPQEARAPAEQSLSLEMSLSDQIQTSDSLPVVTETPVAIELIDQQTLVLKIQKRLYALGFNPGAPDGQFGPRTESAIRAYQASQGLAGDGRANLQLLEHLESR